LVDVGYGKHIRLNHKKGVWTDGKGHHINGIDNFGHFVSEDSISLME